MALHIRGITAQGDEDEGSLPQGSANRANEQACGLLTGKIERSADALLAGTDVTEPALSRAPGLHFPFYRN
jgi:hypothetical protein